MLRYVLIWNENKCTSRDPKHTTTNTNIPSNEWLKILQNMFLRLVNVSEIRKDIKIRVTRAFKIQHSAIFFPNSA